MARVKRGVTTHARHRKMVKLGKSYRGRASTCFRIAIEKVEKALRYAYRDRRNRKREFRKLWIVRINAGARQHGLTYARLMNGLKLAGVTLNRKMLAEIAIAEPQNFAALAQKAGEALKSQKKAA
ncbi:MAG: 50S ribosomal protein L20 [Proteobacteria bacterium]|nr:50S ribosomal protein L20 [Pseudomonadota bacterium]